MMMPRVRRRRRARAGCRIAIATSRRVVTSAGRPHELARGTSAIGIVDHVSQDEGQHEVDGCLRTKRFPDRRIRTRRKTKAKTRGARCVQGPVSSWFSMRGASVCLPWAALAPPVLPFSFSPLATQIGFCTSPPNPPSARSFTSFLRARASPHASRRSRSGAARTDVLRSCALAHPVALELAFLTRRRHASRILSIRDPSTSHVCCTAERHDADRHDPLQQLTSP